METPIICLSGSIDLIERHGEFGSQAISVHDDIAICLQALPSVASAPNERWSTDLGRIWAGRDNWATLALVIDCHTRELLSWHLSRSGKALVRSYGLRQEFITPHYPQQNGMVERVIRTLKKQCAHRHRLETLRHASRVIGDWIRFYNHRRPHQAPAMKTPAEAFALAA